MAARVEEPYVPSVCRRCGGAPKLEYNGHYRSAIRSRMRCTRCDTCTDWRPTRFQSEMDWEEGVVYDSRY